MKIDFSADITKGRLSVQALGRFLPAAVFVSMLVLIWMPVFAAPIQYLAYLNRDGVFNIWPLAFGMSAHWFFLPLTVSGILILLVKISRKLEGENMSGREFLRFLKGYFLQKPYHLFFALFLVYAAFSTLFADDIMLALMGDTFCKESIFTFFFYFLVFYTAGQIADDRHVRLLQIQFVIASLPVSLLMLLQYLQIPRIIDIWSYTMRSTFYNTNHAGYYLVMSILCASGLLLSRKSGGSKGVWVAGRVALVSVLLFENWILLKNNTFGAYLAVGFACLALAFLARFHSRRNVILCLLPLLIFLAVSAWNLLPLEEKEGEGGPPQISEVQQNMTRLQGDMVNISEHNEAAGSAGSGRWVLWVKTMEYIGERPVLGYGIDSVGLLLTEQDGLNNGRPHNEYMEIASFFGIPALLLYLAGLFALLGRQLRRLKRIPDSAVTGGAAAIAYAVSAFFGVSMFYTAPFFFLFLGFASRDGGRLCDEKMKNEMLL